MENKQNRNEVAEKSKAKEFWKNVGFIALALVVAIVTVFVLNIDR